MSDLESCQWTLQCSSTLVLNSLNGGFRQASDFSWRKVPRWKKKTLHLDIKRQNLVLILSTGRAPRVHFFEKKALKKDEVKKIAFEIPERKFFKLLWRVSRKHVDVHLHQCWIGFIHIDIPVSCRRKRPFDMAELNPNAELLDLSTKKTTQKIIYNISTRLLMVIIILRSTNQTKKN